MSYEWHSVSNMWSCCYKNMRLFHWIDETECKFRCVCCPTLFERIPFRTWLPFLFANVEIIVGLKITPFKVKDKKCHETISARERPFKSLFKITISLHHLVLFLSKRNLSLFPILKYSICSKYWEWTSKPEILPYAGSHITVQLSATHWQVESPTGIQPSVWPIVASASVSQSST